MGLTENFVRSDQPEQQPDIDVKAAGETFDRNTLAAEVQYEMNKRLRCGLRGGYSFFLFSNEPDDVAANRVEFNVGGIINYVLNSRTIAGIAYDFSDTAFKDISGKGSGKHSITLNYQYSVRKAFSVSAHAGYGLMYYREGEVITGASAGASLNFDISRLTTFSLNCDYSFDDSSREDYLAYRDYAIGGALRHNLTPRLAISAASSCSLWLYDTGYKVDNSGAGQDKMSSVIGFDCGINYKLTKMIDIGATYDTNAKFSDFGDDEYFVNHYLLTIRASF